MNLEAELERSAGWKVADHHVQSLGPLSSLFTAAIRAVRSAPQILRTDSPEKIKKFSIEAVNFPVKVSPTFKTAYYFVAEEVDEAELALTMPLSQQKLLSLFSPDELIAVIALTYMYRLMKRRCDEEEWARIAPKMAVHMAIGFAVGGRTNGVGSGNGMLIGGIRFIAQSILMYSDLKNFKELRRKTESKNVLFDLAEEQARWGCNHLQIASFLVSNLGYGVGPRMAFGVDTDSKVFGPLQPAIIESQEEINAWRTAIACTESLHSKGCVPDFIKGDENKFLAASIGAELEKRALSIVAKGQGYQWLFKIPEDLPPHVRQQLNIRVTAKKEGAEVGSEEEA